jgi:type VI secretion system protein ImpK
MEECLAGPRERYYLLELIYVVMALGFEGPFRLDARGPLLLIQYRERLLATIRQEADHHPRASVSPAGQSSAHKALAFLNPFTMALGGVLFIAISLGIAVLLFGETEEGLTAEEGNAAVLAVLASPELQPVEDPVPARTRQILRDDLASRTVSLEETPSSMMVTLTEDDLFPPGAADLRPDADGMLRRVGAAIGVASGPVCVIIVRNRAAEGLSEQRAEAVVGYLAPWAQEKGEKIMRTVIDPPASAGTPSFPAGEVQIVLGKSVRPWSPAAGALPAVAWY